MLGNKPRAAGREETLLPLCHALSLKLYQFSCRLENPESAEEEEMIEKTQMNLDAYAKQGLRVLVMAKRILPEEEYLEWLAKHRDAEVLEVNSY